MLEPSLGSERPKRAKVNPRGPSRASKSQKNNIFKKVVFAWDIRHFFALRASQKSVKGPKKAPKRHPKNSKTPKKEPKIGPKNYKKIGPIFGATMQKNKANNYKPELGTFWGPPSPASQGSK